MDAAPKVDHAHISDFARILETQIIVERERKSGLKRKLSEHKASAFQALEKRQTNREQYLSTI